MALVHRHLNRQTIGRAGGGEDEGLHTGLNSSRHQRQRADHVVVVETDRVLDRFPYFDESREMQNRFGLVFCKHFIQSRMVTDIALFELAPADEFRVSIREIVENDGLVTSFSQYQTRMGADITGTAHHKHFLLRHHVLKGC
ncbi:hypothetical protein D3C87_1699000 [compost metagenome]